MSQLLYMCTNTIHVHRSSLHPVKIIDGLVFIFPIIIARVKKGDSPRGANKYGKLHFQRKFYLSHFMLDVLVQLSGKIFIHTLFTFY